MTKIDEIKDNTNLIPIVGAYFILYGSVDLITFYKEFNIAIIYFINFSEIVFYFIRDIYSVIAHVFIMIIAIIGFDYIKLKALDPIERQIPQWEEDKKQIIDTLASIETEKSDIEDTKKKLQEAISLNNRSFKGLDVAKSRLNRIKIILGFVWFFIIVLFAWLTSEFGWLKSVRFLIPVFVSFGAAYFIKDFKFFMIIYILVSLLSSAYFNALDNAESVRSGRNYGMNADIDGRFIHSDSSSYIIGKTENYLFYYESKLKKTTIYSTEKMNYIIIPDK